MGLMQKLQMFFLKRFGISQIKGLNRLERSLTEEPGAVVFTDASPKRFNIPLEMMKLVEEKGLDMQQAFPMGTMRSIMSNIKQSIQSVTENPEREAAETVISADLLNDLEDYAESLGIGSIGYAKLPRKLVFEDMGVLFDKTVILAMEMDSEKIQQAPSQETFEMIHETYDLLGIAANRIAEKLREWGYAAQAGHPMGGLTLYPPHAQMAGIGWIGKHGLLITPDFGPRVRLAAVYTNIENLPFAEQNEHKWIGKYCESCGLCINQCPTDAIYQNPIEGEHGRLTHIDSMACFEYFAQEYGCTICVKVCPFSKRPYDVLKMNLDKHT